MSKRQTKTATASKAKNQKAEDKKVSAQKAKTSTATRKNPSSSTAKAKATSPGPKKVASQKAAPKKVAPKRETVASLREHFEGIISRLKAADTNNRKNVKSLETAFATLENQVKSHQDINHAELALRVDQLSEHLTQSISKTKRDIAADMRTALENPSIEGIENAIQRSEDRLAETEMAQAQSISRVNKHIAELARVIDARLKSHEGKTKDQAEKIDALDEKLTSIQSQSYERIRMVENTTADAMRKLGDDVVGTAENFQSQLANQSASLRERIEQIAKNTQADFDRQATDISRRMESLEDSQKNQSSYVDRSISKLAARIDSLEFGLSQSPVETSESLYQPEISNTDIPAAAPILTAAPAPEPEVSTPVAPAPIQSVPPLPVVPPLPIAPDPVMEVEPVEPLMLETPQYEMPAEEEEYDAFAAADAEVTAGINNVYSLQPEMVEPAEDAVSEYTGYQTGTDPYATAYTPSEAPQSYTPAAMQTPLYENTATPTTNAYGYAPQEYNPNPQADAVSPQHHYVDPAQAAYAAQQAQQAQMAQSNAAYAYDTQAYNAEAASTAPSPYAAAMEYSPTSTEGPTEFTPQIADSELPYENPGYGEAVSAEDGISRPGHVAGKPKKQKRKKSVKAKLEGSSALTSLATPKNLRVAGLAVAVALVGYFGLRGFMGNSDPEQPRPVPTASAPLPSATAPTDMSAIGAISDVSTTDPIGDYGDNGAVDGQSTAALSLNSDMAVNQSLAEAADSGNSIAQFQLGITYLDTGQTDDGLRMIRAAANNGQPAAQYRLAKLYEAGIGVAADPDMARDLTERAARSGNRIAMHDLGLYYAEGRGGVDKNMQTALNWFEKAAERGVVDSQYNLGVLFSATPEIPKDLAAAYVWFSIASKQGDQFASNELARIKPQLSAEQLKQADARINGFKPVAIDEAANGIFRDVPWAMPDANSFAPTAELVRDAQMLLGQLGYDIGVPDGDMGPKTRSAVIAFEKANGLPETGMVSGSLIDRLEAAVGV